MARTSLNSYTKPACRLIAVFAGLVSATILLGGCAARDIKREIQIPPELRSGQTARPVLLEPKMPELAAVTEEISPLRTRIVDVTARNTPLRDVLHVIADATGLNIVMERDVNPESPVTMTLKNVSAKDALDTIFASVDYLYSIENNMLYIRATDTRIFELGYPAIVQNYSIDVGGDILSGATTSGSSGGSSSGSGSSSGGSSSGSSAGSSGTGTIRGNVSQATKSDNAAFNFWDSVEKSLATLLRTAPATAAGPATAGAQAQIPYPTASASSDQFTVNRLTGTVMVNASKKSLKRVEQYLTALKKVINRQIQIEAKIIEVRLSDNYQFGVDWALVGYKSGIGTYGGANLNMSNISGFDLNPGTRSTANITSIPNATPQNGFSKPGFNIGITGNNFAAVLTALQEQGELRALSNPRVSIMNGQTALLSVGRNTNYIAKVETTVNSGTTNNLITYTVTQGNVLSGIIIGLVPYISDTGEISLTITPIISNLVSLDDKFFGAANQNQASISLPTVDLRELSTTVKVRDGQMVVIGGLIDQKEQIVDDKVPGLGDIPLLGTLFNRRVKTSYKSELVVILQPVILSR
ncbi:MAG TPA: pilus (MSHA type) biogenesis protein MshL [Dissulfurispiraceae bacterium]|nr:pilus (MSHA type) biogenesis protein MshL [Dissulfurispiraceae bacterium]